MGKATSKTRATTSAKTASKASARDTEAKGDSVTAAQRQHMIAEAAYFRAQQRGFQYGDPQQDWLAAEAGIDQMLASPLH